MMLMMMMNILTTLVVNALNRTDCLLALKLTAVSVGFAVIRLTKCVALSLLTLLRAVTSLNRRRRSRLTQCSDQSVNKWMCTMKLPGQSLTVYWKDTTVGVFFVAYRVWLKTYCHL